MSTANIVSRLTDGDRLLLDGANGTELKRRGVTRFVNPDGSVREGITRHSANAIMDAPNEVRQIHEDYLRAGADVVTTNTFNTNRGKLIGRGLPHLADRAEEYTNAAAELTIAARDDVKPEAYVAGSISTPHMGKDYIAEIDPVDEYRTQAKTLANAGVDVLALEYVRTVEAAVLAMDAVSHFGVPVFLGMANVTPEGTLEDGRPVEDLVEALKGREPAAILTMCSRPDGIAATLPKLRAAFEGPVGGYSNLVQISDEYAPSAYASAVRGWVDDGAQVVGGCCGSTPEHIAALREMLG